MSKPSIATLRKRVRATREATGWSIRELGRQSGISNAQLSQLEGGLSNNPTFGTVCAIAKALDVSVGYLVGETDG